MENKTKKENAEEDYAGTPISVLAYVTELEDKVEYEKRHGKAHRKQMQDERDMALKAVKELEESESTWKERFTATSLDYGDLVEENEKLQKEKAGLEEACRMAKNMVDGDTKMDTLRLLEALAQADKTNA